MRDSEEESKQKRITIRQGTDTFQNSSQLSLESFFQLSFIVVHTLCLVVFPSGGGRTIDTTRNIFYVLKHSHFFHVSVNIYNVPGVKSFQE